jgi:hypothetical protein
MNTIKEGENAARLVPRVSLRYQFYVFLMHFSHFTSQNITVDGAWQGDERQLQFTGLISSSAPFLILSLLKCSDEYHYIKHRKSKLSNPIEDSTRFLKTTLLS